ncbi:MAG: hypothetical protein WCA27_34070 [Candidatus Sulfotelmatobacter sp.]
MTVQRNTEGVLVVQNSTLWLSAVFGVVGLVMIAAAFFSGDKRLAAPALVMGLFAVLCLSKYTFVFDSTQRMVRWQIMRFGKRRAGSMPFDDVKDVVLQSEPGKSGRPTYRLAMLTAEGPMPLSSGYGDTSDRCLALQSQILQLLRPGQAVAAAAPASSIAAHLESSVRTLVAQGRKIDAIKLLTSMGMNLTEAKQRVDEIEKQQVS